MEPSDRRPRVVRSGRDEDPSGMNCNDVQLQRHSSEGANYSLKSLSPSSRANHNKDTN